jgi:two-component system response regulator YesN
MRNCVLKPTDYANIRSVFTKLKRELDSQKVSLPDAVEAGSNWGSAVRGDAVVAAIRGYVERDYTHATLKGAARVVHMNPQYVSRLFKERAGDT